jgi:hypothetical protein
MAIIDFILFLNILLSRKCVKYKKKTAPFESCCDDCDSCYAATVIGVPEYRITHASAAMIPVQRAEIVAMNRKRKSRFFPSLPSANSAYKQYANIIADRHAAIDATALISVKRVSGM